MKQPKVTVEWTSPGHCHGASGGGAGRLPPAGMRERVQGAQLRNAARVPWTRVIVSFWQPAEAAPRKARPSTADTRRAADLASGSWRRSASMPGLKCRRNSAF